MKSLVLIILLFLFQKVENAKILGIFMGYGRNHYFLGSSLMKILAAQGHEVVLLSQYGDQTHTTNYKEIIVHSEEHSDTIFKAMRQTNRNSYRTIKESYTNSKKIVPMVFDNNDVKNLLNSTFDLVIVEQVFMDALKVFAWHFNAPLIVFHPLRADVWVNPYVGNPNLPSFIPEYPATYDMDMSFFERLENLYLYFSESLFRELVCLKEQQEIMMKYFPGAPDLSDIAYNTSLVLLNSDVAMNQPVPKVPNMIDIGGFHMMPPKALPSEVENFLKNSTKGVVYVDLDFLTSYFIPEETRIFFIELFSKFEYDFLWQWDEERVPNQPPNVMICKKIPLQDVLAHSKIKLFIHLGEPQNILESINYGIPQLLLPVFDDQLYNAVEAQHFDYAWSVPFAKLNEKDFTWALNELLDNDQYLKESQRRSVIFKAKLISSKKTAIYWVEYVLRTKGAKHMRSAALDYSWYQLFMLDIVGFFIVLILLIYFSIKISIKWAWRKCMGKCCPKKKNERDSDYVSVNESESEML